MIILLANINRLRKFRVKEVTLDIEALNDEDNWVISRDLTYLGLSKETIRKIFIKLNSKNISGN